LQYFHRLRDGGHKQRWWHAAECRGGMGCSGQWTPEHTGRRIRAACLQGVRKEEERQPGAEQPEHDRAQGNNVSESDPSDSDPSIKVKC